MYDYTQDNLTISNSCYNCMLMDAVCQECEDSKDAKLTDMAWELVDDGNLQYKFTLSYNVAQPSGHDWISSTTALVKPAVMPDGTLKYEREEYMPPIVNLQDGGVYEELWELDDERQRAREVECKWCHILTPKMYNDCQDCDKPLELNVR